MKRFSMYMIALVGGLAVSAMAGEASTNAWANNASGGNAGATARYNGAPGSLGVSRTRTQTGDLNLSRGLAVGLDNEGLDVSFSHAVALPTGPAYAGTFNLSIGLNGAVNGSYGGVLSEGGAVRSVEAGGSTRSGVGPGSATAMVRGDATPGGRVVAHSNSYSTPRPTYVRSSAPKRVYSRYTR